MQSHTEKYSIHRIGVGGLCEHKNKILLVKIAYGPSKGKWILPGGLVERKETLSEAVEREMLEETGIQTKAKELLSARHMVTRKNNGEHASDLYLTFRVQYVTGDLQPCEEEVAKAEFIAFNQLATLRVGELVRHVIKQTASKQGPPKTSYQPSSPVKKKLKVFKYELYT
ncbi:MAG: NUDIX domain-containing protein [Candidatus Thorarchaeota archaeon]|nr:NUDIX domain-containing protein [Candidatus Thorarchaeota archaeon]NIW15584.1 NUDIX domain-containing protein [Candidatus Thorarchaeota archaeon]